MNQIGGKIEIDDVIVGVKELKEVLKRSPLNILINIWKGIGLAYVIITALKSFYASNFNIAKLLDFGQIFIALILFIVPWIIYPLLSDMVIKRKYHSNRAAEKAMTYIIDDFGIRVSDENGERTYHWTDIYRVKETQLYLELCTAKYMYIIPRRYLESRPDVINFIKNKVPEIYVWR